MVSAKLSSHWELPSHGEASLLMGSFILNRTLPTQQPLGSFIFTDNFPFHWEASYSLDSFLLTGKLLGDWKAPFSPGSILLIENFHPTEKILSHRKVSLSSGSGKWKVGSLFTGMLLLTGKLFTTTKLFSFLMRSFISSATYQENIHFLPRRVHVTLPRWVHDQEISVSKLNSLSAAKLHVLEFKIFFHNFTPCVHGCFSIPFVSAIIFDTTQEFRHYYILPHA